VLRAGINMSNFLLVTGTTETGDPDGVSPDMARAVAASLGVPVQLVSYPGPGALADAAELDEWDIGLIGAEPARAERIAFSAAYAEIEATYLVRDATGLRTMADVDAPGVRIAVADRSAYGLWLDRNIQRATLMRADGLGGATRLFAEQRLDALAGLRPGLMADLPDLAGCRILDGQFTAVQQAIGTPRANAEAASYLAAFVEQAKRSGLVAELIARHKVVGLSVAPAS
jgi:polar amino acid transport system substrate-binding protein